MCGIAGIILKKQNTIDLSQSIILMSDALNHRGPDGEGFILSSKNETVPFFNKSIKDFLRTDLNYIPQSHISKATNHNFLAFAHRRLSIIDLTEAGHQPMKSSIGDVWITFNGEIYNYIELKADLKKLGHVFVSETDTEVVLNAYKQWGHKCVEKFKNKFEGQEIKRPPYWGGWVFTANYYEFWQGRKSRLHDRICYNLKNTDWSINRIAP